MDLNCLHILFVLCVLSLSYTKMKINMLLQKSYLFAWNGKIR